MKRGGTGKKPGTRPQIPELKKERLQLESLTNHYLKVEQMICRNVPRWKNQPSLVVGFAHRRETLKGK